MTPFDDRLAGRTPCPADWRSGTVNASRLIMLGLVTVAALALGAASPEVGADFVVVVNAGNPTSALPASEISQMFLQKSTQWKSGEKVMAVDLMEDSSARQAFSKAIHNRTTSAVKAYWQTMIFSGRAVPPPEKPTAADILVYVRGNAGAIAYLPSGTALPDGVKVLKVLMPGSAASEQTGLDEEVLAVEGTVTKPEAIAKAEPLYTETARRARIEGKVTIEAIIDKHGNVVSTRVLDSLPLGLDKAAVDAVKKWRFKPATQNGQPVNVRYILAVNFALQ